MPEPGRCASCNATHWSRVFDKGAHSYFRCGGCGLVVALPIPEPSDLRALYNREYADPGGAGASLAAQREMARATADWRLRAARRVVTGKRWLEVGCGTGPFLERATAAGLEVEGIDVSDVAVADARAHGLRARALQLSELSADEPVDVIAAFDLIEHLPDPAGFLEQVHRVLRPGGFLVLTTPDTHSVSARLLRRAWFFYIPLVHVMHFDRANLAQLLVAHGFEVIHQGVAAKCLTIDYTVEQLGVGNPLLHSMARALARLLPQRLRRYVFRLPIGEQLAVARLRGAGAA